MPNAQQPEHLRRSCSKSGEEHRSNLSSPPNASSHVTIRRRRQNAHNSNQVLYSAPTTDTLGDGDSVMLPVATPRRLHPPHSHTRPRIRSMQEPLVLHSSRSRLHKLSSHSISQNPRRRNDNKNNTRRLRPRRHRIPGNEFQQPMDWMATQCITVSLSQRSAFCRLRLPTTTTHSSKRSPSPGHLSWIRQLHQTISHFRQVQFVNCVSLDDDYDEHHQGFNRSNNFSPPTPLGGSSRYQPISPDPLQSPAPVLSHQKTRLPHRADVGFPNAAAEDIQSKQIEIRWETLQEETVLRLIHYVPSTFFRDPGEVATRNQSSIPYEFRIVSPPWQSIPSPSQGFRPRPLQDRPAWLQFLYVHCSFPKDSTIGSSSSFCLALYNDQLQKCSENFHFLPGQKAIFSIPSVTSPSNCHHLPRHYRSSFYAIVLRSTEHWGVTFLPIATIVDHEWPQICNFTMSLYDKTKCPFSLINALQQQQQQHNLEVSMSVSETTSGANEDIGIAPPANSKKLHPSRNANRMGRLFRSPQKQSPASQAGVKMTNDGENAEPLFSTESCSVWISHLGGDFLQPLLSTAPHEMGRTVLDGQSRLLCDVTGDCAVVLDSSDQQLLGTHVRRRSDLTRLPPASLPAAYAAAAEFREILYLPPQHYEYDRPTSMMNLLYLFPRLLRRTTEKSNKQPTLPPSLAIRIRVYCKTLSAASQSGSGEDETALIVPNAFYATKATTDKLGTTVSEVTTQHGDCSSRLGSSLFYDEFKLRLPFFLDKRFTLQVSLLTGHDEAAIVWLPLCSSSQQHSSKVVTIIPNGNHRLKLGEYQLQLETRLVSTVHVADTPVAAFLRESPFSVGSNIPSSDQSSQSAPIDASLQKASSSAVRAHALPLLYANLWHLAQSDGEATAASSLQSLFDLFNKLKLSMDVKDELDAYRKMLWDDFDESYLTGDTGVQVVDHDTDDEALLEDETDESDSGGGQLKRVSIRKSPDPRLNRMRRSLEDMSSPLARTSYGASKLDRMRIEAEIHTDVNHAAFTPCFDDDETIATLPSILTDSKSFMDMTGRCEHNILLSPDESRQNSLVTDKVVAGENDHQLPNEFATRVKSVAQIVLAPCVGPSISNMLSVKSDPSPRSAEYKERTPVTIRKEADNQAFTCSPGSDVDHSHHHDDTDSVGEEFTLRGKSVFRGPIDGPILALSLHFEDDAHVPGGTGDFLYESIIIMWLRAWLDHVERILRDQESRSAVQAATFAIPPYDLDGKAPRSIFSFYAHLDFLLPICLKSFIFRYNNEILSQYPVATKAVLDDSHMLLLEPFVELLARGMIGQAISGIGSSESKESSMERALKSSDQVLDFLLGLFSFLHPEHCRAILAKYLQTLRNCETEHLGIDLPLTEFSFRWTDESLQRVRCSREIRIRLVDSLLGLPSFLALNYPLKFSGHNTTKKRPKASWLNQYKEYDLGPKESTEKAIYDDGIERLPKSAWLSDLVVGEGLSVCALSCEAVVAEAMAQIEMSRSKGSSETETLYDRPAASLKREDLVMFQSLGARAITAVYERGLRRHALDRRYQSESTMGRIAGLFATAVLDKSIASVRWISRMDSTHQIRCLWLLSFTYVLQESPDPMVREYVQVCCNPADMRIHRFIRLLRLCSATFQGFIENRQDLQSHGIDPAMSPWLLQESFNTVCSTINVVVEECVNLTSSYPLEQEKMMQGILDLLLHVLTTPQSPVTHLRALGGALQTLEQCGVALFLETIGDNLQHWIRVILSLMNSVSLSVRSIAVDFVTSLLGMMYDLEGNIETIAIVFATVIPEVAAREIALYTVTGLISSMEDITRSLWPLRRSFADLEDSNPLDDDRIDPELPNSLKPLCRACQASMDGVILEIRLKWSTILGVAIAKDAGPHLEFDADEESLYEGASFFVPESGPLQRLRWLETLVSLHESKRHWVEAAGAVYLCARTVVDSIQHLDSIWRPSRFALWTDSRRSLWLDSVGVELGRPEGGNAQVMNFANEFLEPSTLRGDHIAGDNGLPIPMPGLSNMCKKVVQYSKKIIELCLRDDEMVEFAYSRLELLQTSLVSVLNGGDRQQFPSTPQDKEDRRRQIRDEANLRRVMASISSDMTKLAEKLLLITESEPESIFASVSSRPSQPISPDNPCFILLKFSGKKPSRFQESTALPTFVEWDTPCVCRVPPGLVKEPSPDPVVFPRQLCAAFARPYVLLLRDAGEVIVNVNPFAESTPQGDQIVIHVSILESTDSRRQFILRNDQDIEMVEVTVAEAFPCALSRQKIVLRSETVPPSYTV